MLKNIINKTLNMNIKILNLNYKNINRTKDKSIWIKCKDPQPLLPPSRPTLSYIPPPPRLILFIFIKGIQRW